jgi:hypothetical protein
MQRRFDIREKKEGFVLRYADSWDLRLSGEKTWLELGWIKTLRTYKSRLILPEK